MEKIKIFKNSAFKDKRGLLWTSWNNKILNYKFNHDKFSISKKNVFRGLHGDKKTYKLLTCVFGKVFFVYINFNKKSKNYLKAKTLILSHENRKSILLPPYYLNGHYCLSNECVFHYKLFYKGKYFDTKDQLSMKWNDKRIQIKWPFSKSVITSKRDKC